ncbi:uncharacterized protein C19orf44 homolog [Tachyglossus aculeatus]|uniref:uncharacterized protein C19orf44 homolog n=1 Tax=Tachyglossus aculeatus TaxID=9261 RepID=UPI0018F39EF5|nr:uncharacterized protein C19orf44 homolog [Tachyglossus aculeatus]XP_038627864.1 uncharacterized protein C19orf44 homolog [Tachyglossus aculeatus]
MFSTRKTTRLKGYRLASDCFSDLSDISCSDSEMNEPKNSKPQGLMEASPGHSRFLKKKQITAKPAGDSEHKLISSKPVTTPSTIRANAALLKLAQIETKIKNRNLKMDLSDSDSDLLSADQRPISKSNEQTIRGSELLEKKAAAIENTSSKTYLKEETNSQTSRKIGPAKKLVSLGSDEEEMRQLGKFVKSSSKSEKYKNRVFKTHLQEKEAKEPYKDPIRSTSATFSPITEGSCHVKLLQLSSLASENLKTFPHKACSRTPSPPRHSGTEAGSLMNTISRSPSPSIEDYFARPTALKMEHIQLASASERSEVESLDELFSEAASSCSNDFRANILSLDDLASISISERPELEQKEEDTQLAKSDKGVNSDVMLTLEGVLSHPKERRTNVSCPVDVEEVIPTETEISEHLNEDSSALSEKENAFSLGSASPEPQKSVLNSVYSEDFERYSDSATYEQTVCSGPSPDITLQSSSKSSSYSRTDTRSSRSSPEINKKWSEKVRRVTVKETAVQTHDPAFAYHWVNGSTATIGPTLGGTYVDPAPIASHVVSADAVEALTAYSPAVFALNDMLKQQLLLTQQFVETSRHLHISLLESLEDELFQYQTLEETKEYIKNHKPPPLTIEKALEEVVKEMGEH